MRSNEKDKEWLYYLAEARKEHLHVFDSAPFPNFVEFSSDTDIYLGDIYGETTIPAARSLFMQPSDDLEKQIVYTARLDNADEVLGIPTEPTDDTGELRFVMEPAAISTIDGTPITFPELLLWLALNVAPDDDTRNYLFKRGYNIPDSAFNGVRRGANVDATKVISPIDAATRRLFSTGDDKIKPEQLFSMEPIEVITRHAKGNLSAASLSMVVKTDADIDKPESEYLPSPRDRYWLDAIYTRAWNDGGEPVTIIKGADLLKIAGYSNPYAPSMKTTMGEALSTVLKLSATRIQIDTTNEHGAFDDVDREITLRPIINCGDVKVQQRKDGSYDFAIELSENLADSLPLLGFAIERKQFISFDTRFYEFKTVKRLTGEHRLMWHYILRRAMEKHSSSSIKFDTMFREIDLEDANSRKRGQMLVMLKKMLREKKDDGVIDYTWNKNGKKDYSVTVEIME